MRPTKDRKLGGKPITHQVISIDDPESNHGEHTSEIHAQRRADLLHRMLSGKAKGTLRYKVVSVKEDYAPAAPTTAPNTSLGIKAGPIQIGKPNKDKNGKTGQGSQAPPSGNQIIMAGDNKEGNLIEAQEHDSSTVRPKDFIHAGYGAKGGAGIHGHVDKVTGNSVHFTGSATEIGMNGKPFKKTYKVPLKHVTILHREDYVVDMTDLEPILNEVRKKGIPLEGHPYHKKTDAELHYIMKDAGEASRLHDQMHKDPKTYPNKYADQVNDAATVLHYRRKGGIIHKEYNDHNHHSPHPDEDNNHHWKVGHIKEDLIYEAGKISKDQMKRKYIGKTRGTTATGKRAHEVIIDPIIKTDDKMANRKQALPAPDRGM